MAGLAPRAKTDEYPDPTNRLAPGLGLRERASPPGMRAEEENGRADFRVRRGVDCRDRDRSYQQNARRRIFVPESDCTHSGVFGARRCYLHHAPVTISHAQGWADGWARVYRAALVMGLVLMSGCTSVQQDSTGGTVRNSATALSAADTRCRESERIAMIRYIDRASNTIAFDCVVP